MQYLKTPEAFSRIISLIRNDLDERDLRILAIHLYRGDHLGKIIEMYRKADAEEAEEKAKSQTPKRRKHVSVALRARLQKQYQAQWRAKNPEYRKCYKDIVVRREAQYALIREKQEKEKIQAPPCPIMAEVNKQYDECLLIASDLAASIRSTMKDIDFMPAHVQGIVRRDNEPKLRSLRRMVDTLRSLGECVERAPSKELVAELESFEATFASK